MGVLRDIIPRTRVLFVAVAGVALGFLLSLAIPAQADTITSAGASPTTLPLPAGAATAAKQDTGNTSLSSIDGKVATAAKQDTGNTSLSSIDGKVATSAKQDTGNASAASIDGKVSTAVKQDTGNASLSSIDGKLPALGGAPTAASVPVNIASDQIVPVSGTFWQATQPVSGTFWQATQPVSGTVTVNVGTVGTLATEATLLLIAPGRNGAAGDAQKSDVADLSHTGTLWVGTGGTIVATLCDMADGTSLTFPAIPDGSNPPWCVKRLWSTGTTATNISVIW